MNVLQESDEEKVSDHADAVSKYKLRHDDDWQLNGIEGKRIFKAEHLVSILQDYHVF